MILRELLNTEADWEWTNVSPAIASANIMLNQHVYGVEFYSFDASIKAWIVEFTDMSSPDPFAMTNRGDALAILSTVVVIIKDMVSKTGANIVMFEAKEPSRQRVYSHLVSRLSKGAKEIANGNSKRYLIPTSPEGEELVNQMTNR